MAESYIMSMDQADLTRAAEDSNLVDDAKFFRKSAEKSSLISQTMHQVQQKSNYRPDMQ